jgi:hypothetical protein
MLISLGSDDIPFQLSVSPTDIYYISLQRASRKGYRIKVTALDPQTGRLTKQHNLNSENELSSPESVIFVGANTAAPLITWTDKAWSVLKVNVIGSNHINSVNIENDSGEDIRKVRFQAPHSLNSLPHFLIHYETESKSWAEVYHTNFKTSVISKAYRLPVVESKSVFATSTRDANVYFTRITRSEVSVVSSASHGILGRWLLGAQNREDARHAVSEVVARGSTFAVRFAQVLESGDWELVRNGEPAWTRPESLAGAVAATWAETDGGEELVHELEVEGHESLSGAYIHRLKRHARDLRHLSTWLQELPLKILSSFIPGEGPALTQFGLGKLVILATGKGRIIALDSGRQGAILWNVQAAYPVEGMWNVIALTTQRDAVTAYVDDGSYVKVKVLSGEVIERGEPTQKLASIVWLPDTASSMAIGIQANGVPIEAVKDSSNRNFIVTLSNDGRVLGWSPSNIQSPAWEFLPPKGQKIVHATSRPRHDPVASIGKVLGDRSVLYKYLNPNLALLTAVADTTATFYLLDAVSGQLLHASTQTGVDTTKPIASVLSENWFAYSLWADVTDTSDSKGSRLVISELYESPIPNDRGPLGDAANFSSIHSRAGTLQPHIVSQAYMIPEPISTMAVTQTRQGITIRELLCVLPESNAIIGIPRIVLDPRRPIGRDPTSSEAEEGLSRYSPFLDFDARWYLTHAREVVGIQAIESSPTLLESTSLVFAYGLDIFGTRVTPSQAFDVLGKGFSKIQLVLTVMALAVGVAILAPVVSKTFPLNSVKYTHPFASICFGGLIADVANGQVRRRQVDMKWKT